MKIVAVPRRFVRSAWGGTESVVLETGKALRAIGHDVTVFTSSIFSHVAAEEIDGLPVRRFPYTYPWWGLDASARDRMDRKGGNLFSWQLWRALASEPGLDVLHLHTLKRLGGIGRHVARARGVPYVVSLHGGVADVPEAEVEEHASAYRGAFEWGKVLGWWVGSRRVLDDAAAILVLGEAERRHMQDRYPRVRVELAPNGVDPDRFARGDGARFRAAHGLPTGAPLLLNVGRVDPQKNQLALVRVLPRLRAAHPDARLALLGPVTDPRYRDTLLAQIDTLGLGGAVSLLPGLPPGDPALADAYAAADVFALPSRHEPFGIVVLEAWAARRAVLATAVGGLRDLVHDGQDGLLVPPDDDAALAAGLDRLLAAPQLRARLGAAGERAARERYDWRRVAGRLAALYEEVRRAHSLP